MQTSKSYATQSQESQDVIRFEKSLQELRELRSQLPYAADYCEKKFLNAKQKKMVVENTKEYICRAMVAVVDHLGCVSANLNASIISKTNAFSEAELRINCLKQRLISCEKYAHKLALTRVRWSSNLPKFHRRYLLPPITTTRVEKPNEDVITRDSRKILSKDKQGFEGEGEGEGEGEEELHLHASCTGTAQKSTSTKNSGTTTAKDKDKDKDKANLAIPVRDGFSILSKSANPTFHLQQCSPKSGRRSTLSRKHGNDILSLIRRTRRTTL